MSDPLAIAAVTEALTRLLFDGVNAAIPGTTVTAKPLDKARTGVTSNQLNLFLYRTEPSAAWRNQDMPFQVRSGESSPPPLGLDLHYLLTAFGENDDGNRGHRVLGYAMSLLHDHPLLSPDEIAAALPQSNLNDQIERVRITLQPLSLDEMSKIWSALQTQYRISAAYQVAVVLIESQRPRRAALPVLSRGEGDVGPLVVPFAAPVLSAVRPPHPQPAVRQGEDLTLTGHNLNLEGLLARFQHPQLDAVQELTPLEGGTAVQVMVHIPSQAEDADALDDWTPGFYTLSMILDQPVLPSWSSNSLAFALSPTIAISPVSTPAGDITLTVTCSPRLRTGQGVRLLFGESQIVPDSIVTPADTSQPTTLTFLIQDVDPGEYVVRLRVDGVDSLPFVRTPTGLEFAADQQVTVT